MLQQLGDMLEVNMQYSVPGATEGIDGVEHLSNLSPADWWLCRLSGVGTGCTGISGR